MLNKGNNICAITYEGLEKDKLLEKLQQSGMRLNEYANEIFQSPLYSPSAFSYTATVVELSLADIGLMSGGSLGEIRNCMEVFGLSYCPLELAPYIRLSKLYDKDQTELEEKKWGKAPPNSITIFSEPVLKDDNFPKGFYIRTINGNPWLRGYRCSADYVWDPNDRMIFKMDINPLIA